jgi:hypothetical protein
MYKQKYFTLFFFYWNSLFLILVSEVNFRESGYFIYFFFLFNSGVSTSYYVVLERYSLQSITHMTLLSLDFKLITISS